MADKVLFDTNVALDVLLKRPSTFSESNKLWNANDKGLIIGFLTAPSVRDIHYFITKEKNDPARALQAVLSCLASFHICPVDGDTLAHAARMAGP
jgi:predicted nucleic acid-binding protein